VRFNLSRCGERIGSMTRRQPTKTLKPDQYRVKIGKQVLIPARDEKTGKDKLKKEKMKNAQSLNKITNALTPKSSIHHSLSVHHRMYMCCCWHCMR